MQSEPQSRMASKSVRTHNRARKHLIRPKVCQLFKLRQHTWQSNNSIRAHEALACCMHGGQQSEARRYHTSMSGACWSGFKASSEQLVSELVDARCATTMRQPSSHVAHVQTQSSRLLRSGTISAHSRCQTIKLSPHKPHASHQVPTVSCRLSTALAPLHNIQCWPQRHAQTLHCTTPPPRLSLLHPSSLCCSCRHLLLWTSSRTHSSQSTHALQLLCNAATSQGPSASA
jgi:hypothetical protein